MLAGEPCAAMRRRDGETGQLWRVPCVLHVPRSPIPPYSYMRMHPILTQPNPAQPNPPRNTDPAAACLSDDVPKEEKLPRFPACLVCNKKAEYYIRCVSGLAIGGLSLQQGWKCGWLGLRWPGGKLRASADGGSPAAAVCVAGGSGWSSQEGQLSAAWRMQNGSLSTACNYCLAAMPPISYRVFN